MKSVFTVMLNQKLLFLFSGSNALLGITEIGKLMNLAKPTVHGLVNTLYESGFLTQDKDSKKYSLGLKIYELGTSLSGTIKINQSGFSYLKNLSNDTGLMARIAIWYNDMVLVTMNVLPETSNTNFQQLGPAVPAYCTGIGKAILSTFSDENLNHYLNTVSLVKFTEYTITDKNKLLTELKTIKTTKIAFESNEYLSGLSCMSSPVFDNYGV